VGRRTCWRAWTTAPGVVLAQIAVDGKTNEITVFTALLAQAGDLDGVLVTADALHAQREHATWAGSNGQ
jgi:predicted transposase YbfD/YdcC